MCWVPMRFHRVDKENSWSYLDFSRERSMSTSARVMGEEPLQAREGKVGAELVARILGSFRFQIQSK